MGDSAVRSLVSWCERLEELNLRGCAQLTDHALYAFASRSSKYASIRRLDIGGCVLLTDSGVLELLKACSRLQWLNLSGCPRASGMSLFGVSHIEQGCLTYLNVSGFSR